MQFAVEVDVAELLLADIEIGAVDLRAIVEIPMSRRDDTRPGLDFPGYGLRRALQRWRRTDFAFRFKSHGAWSLGPVRSVLDPSQAVKNRANRPAGWVPGP